MGEDEGVREWIVTSTAAKPSSEDDEEDEEVEEDERNFSNSGLVNSSRLLGTLAFLLDDLVLPDISVSGAGAGTGTAAA